ncbi:unnamed protein product [Leptosia nina]|uniref:Uncharacterized protein n=1 Tax=Leptosia nina TaxID=320188 RepID=A0AAV1IYY9_9NEOP
MKTPLEACRVCLEMNVKLIYLTRHSALNRCFECVTGSSLKSKPGLPSYICFECEALLRKFYKFKQQTMKVEKILVAIIQRFGELDKDSILGIDRKSFNIESRFSTLNLLSINIYPLDSKTENTIDSNEKNHETIPDTNKIEIKEESFYQTSSVGAVTTLEQGIDDALDEEAIETLNDWISDDEPLYLHISDKKKDNDPKSDITALPIKEDVEADAETKKRKLKRRKQKVKLQKVERVQRRGTLRTVMNYPKDSVDIVDIKNFVTYVNLTLEEQIEEVEKRKESDNYKNSVFKCDLCYKGFLYEEAWQHHMKKHDKSAGSVECVICKLRFKSQQTLNKHLTGHTDKYLCNACPYVSRHKSQARNHVLWHQGIMYKCPYCDEMISKWTSYLSHVRIKHRSDYVCALCGFSFVSEVGLSQHKSLKHKDDTEPVGTDNSEKEPFCSLCEIKFASSEAYNRHTLTSIKHKQTTDNKIGCLDCGEAFSTAEEMRSHTRLMHKKKKWPHLLKKKDNRTWPIACMHCSEEIPDARTYWAHFRRYHPDKEYPVEKKHMCDICGKSYRSNAFLNYHKLTHLEQRCFKCECGKAFFNNGNLQMHKKTHSEERPYVCSVCGKGFKCKGALDRHFRGHTGVKPYKCEVCGKAFSQSNSCKVHVRTVHLKEPSPYISRSRLEKRNKVTERPVV